MRRYSAPQRRQRTVPGRVDDDVVPRSVAVDLVPGVVDDVVGAEGTHEVGLRCAARRSPSRRTPAICTATTHASRRPDDHHLLPRLHAPESGCPSAVTPEMGTTAACSKEMFAASTPAAPPLRPRTRRTAASQVPYTSSLGRKRVTRAPTASTTWPRHGRAPSPWACAARNPWRAQVGSPVMSATRPGLRQRHAPARAPPRHRSRAGRCHQLEHVGRAVHVLNDRLHVSPQGSRVLEYVVERNAEHGAIRKAISSDGE